MWGERLPFPWNNKIKSTFQNCCGPFAYYTEIAFC